MKRYDNHQSVDARIIFSVKEIQASSTLLLLSMIDPVWCALLDGFFILQFYFPLRFLLSADRSYQKETSSS